MSGTSYLSTKLDREAHLLYIEASFGGQTPSWYLVGREVDNLSIELNPDNETKKNILGEDYVNDNGYKPSISVETFYANPNDGDIYTNLRNIAMNRLKGDSCKTKVLEVLVDKTTAPYDGWKQDAIIKPQSYGGEAGNGVKIPFTITFTGTRETCSVWFGSNKTPLFEAPSSGT